MAENLSKNKLLLEEKKGKRKLYKSWKLYASALGIIIIGTGTGLGIYFGVSVNNSELKPKLSSLKLNTTLTTPYTNQEAAFQAFLSLNSTVTDLKDNVEVETFTAPTYATFGSLAIKAKENSKYTGTITISISKLVQTNLNQMITLKTILGEGITTENQALQAVAKTIGWSNLNDFAEVETFTAATYTTDGLLTITAKANNIYTGSVTITITKLAQTDLNNLGLYTTITELVTNQLDAFQAFLNLNLQVSDLKNNVEAGTFTTPTPTIDGSLIINATTNGKYFNSLTVIITKLEQTDLSTLGLNTTLTTPVGSQQTAFDTFIKINSNISDLKDNVEATTFIAPTYETLGSLAINAKANSKYIGTITINIPKKAQTNLNQMITVKTIAGEGITTENQALQAVAKTIGWPNLSDFAEIETFIAPTSTSDGSLTITAKANTMYTGSVIVTINKLATEAETQIVTEINNNKNYLITATNGSNTESIIKQINAKLIKQQLAGDVKKNFNPDLFTVNKITVDNHDLNDNDLTNNTLVKAKINYNYNAMSKEETNLKINLIATLYDQDIVTAINNIIYEVRVTKGTTAESLTSKINAEFIEEQLIGEVATIFDASKFKLNLLVINSNELQDSDLTTEKTINAIINYTYTSIDVTAETNLTIIIE